MEVIRVLKPNHTQLIIDTERSIEAELSEAFSFFVPNYKFMNKYKYGVWDGKIRIYDMNRKTFPAGLFHELIKFAKARDYKIELHEDSLPIEHNKDTYDLDIPLTASDGSIIEPRDYQYASVNYAIQNHRGLVISPTGTGKSLIIYMIYRYFSDKKFLIVVPTVSLVEQMYGDFLDYSQKDPSIDMAEEAHRIYSGHEKISDKRCTISTWQSIHKMPRSWFEQFDAVIGDEAHGFKAQSLTHIMNSSVNADVRIGTTGTLDGSMINELVLKGLFGEIFTATTTKEQMDKENLSSMTIDAILLKHDKQPKMKYHDEIAHIVNDKKRNLFIAKLALNQKSNTLVLFNQISHGKAIFELIKKHNKDTDRPIYYIAGEVGAKEREEIRHAMETHPDAILVASLGTFSVGVNLKNLHNIIFASPTKSQIRVLQAIGRGLRKYLDYSLRIYDVIDDYTGGRKDKNYALRHGIERLKIYKRQQFDVQHHSFKL